MNKEQLLKHLQPDRLRIYFALSKEKEPDLFTRAIQKFQGTSYSHSLVIYYSLDFRDYVVANSHGNAAQLDTLDQFYEVDEVEHLYCKRVSPSERMVTIRKIIELDGIDYSESQIFELGIGSIFGQVDKDNDLDGVICSEYADRIAMASGLESTSTIVNKGQDHITPKDNKYAWDKLANERPGFIKLF